MTAPAGAADLDAGRDRVMMGRRCRQRAGTLAPDLHPNRKDHMSDGLVAFDRLWERLRAPNDELRPRLADWFRRVVPPGTHIPQEHGPPVAITPSVSAARYDDAGWQVMLNIYRGPRERFHIAPAEPVEPTADEWRLLGLDGPRRSSLPLAWLIELAGEAWDEAGLTARGLPLYVGSGEQYLGPGARMSRKDMLRARAYRATAPLPPGVTARAAGYEGLLAPPSPLTLPETRPELVEACRAGEPGAALAWAEALDAAGDRRSAELLRWVHGFPAAAATGVSQWAGRGAFWVYAEAHQFWWGHGEWSTEPGENREPATRLAELLMGWNVYHPAVEWLLRRLNLLRVEVQTAHYVGPGGGRNVKVDLGAGKHLTPFDEFTGVGGLHADTPRARKRPARG